MKTFIVAFDSLHNPTRMAAGCVGVGARKEFFRMKAANESLDGLRVVQLHNDDAGCIATHVATYKPAETKKKGIK